MPTIEQFELDLHSDENFADGALIGRLSDDEIDARAAADPDAQPTDAAFWDSARLRFPTGKTRVAFDLDNSVVAWLEARGRARRQSMSEVLGALVERQRSWDMSEVAEPPAKPYDADFEED